MALTFRHEHCRHHVSLGTGVCYCPATNCVYSQPHSVLAKSFLEGETLDRDLKIFRSQVLNVQRYYGIIKPFAFVMLADEGVLPGMMNDGLEYQKWAEAMARKEEQCP